MALGRRLAAMAALTVLTACSTPYRTPVFASNSGDTAFDGIASHLSPERPLDVLLVHGMCTHDGDWARSAVQGIVSALGEDPSGVALERREVEGTGVLLYQQTLPTARGAIRASAIVWSPLTTPLKGLLCYDQSDKSPTCPADEAAKAYPYQRASLNRLLKDTILDDCLADAVIYQGKARDEINAQMQRAIVASVAPSGGRSPAVPSVQLAASVSERIPLVVVTESLGSKVAFDALDRLATQPATAAAGQRTWDRIAQIFMGANQLLILALADRRLDGTLGFAASVRDGYPEDPIAALLERGARTMREGRALGPQVVAFTDPNDLLSYGLASRPAAVPYRVVDVVVSNAPAYLGLVELPNAAHLGYRENPVVRRLIACGTTGQGCR